MSMTETEPRTFDPTDTLPPRDGWYLAREADCGSPSAQRRYGINFLQGIRDDVLERVQEGDEPFGQYPSDVASEVADGAVPIYTTDLWETFVDLQAYDEDTHGELGDDGSDLTKSAQYALYLIGSRLAHRLIEQILEAHAEFHADDDIEDPGQ